MRARGLIRSRLTQFLLMANLTSIVVLLVGVSLLSEIRPALAEARLENLRTIGEFVANVVATGATNEVPEMDEAIAVQLLDSLYVPTSIRVRLFDEQGAFIAGADSYLKADNILVANLEPPRQGEAPARADQARLARAALDAAGRLNAEVALALEGSGAAGGRIDDSGRRVLSVSIPIQRVKAVLGVVTVEAADVDAIIAAERRAQIPFALTALAVTVAMSALLTIWIANPVRALAVAADRVRREGPRDVVIPDLASRGDEIGDLSIALAGMTRSLAERIDAIEAFAADVAHEIKNPLGSLRSAVELLPSARSEAQSAKLLGVIAHDVKRIDRLITDINAASRMDAELSRASSKVFEFDAFLADVVSLYDMLEDDARKARVCFECGAEAVGVRIEGQDSTLARVFRNLIDNARSFSPPGGSVRVRLSRWVEPDQSAFARVEVDDDGPGVPEENLERIFERFYTQRPKGAEFGENSGLGLAIARQIVESHRGRLWAENRSGAGGARAGARFIVIVPIVRRP